MGIVKYIYAAMYYNIAMCMYMYATGDVTPMRDAYEEMFRILKWK